MKLRDAAKRKEEAANRAAAVATADRLRGKTVRVEAKGGAGGKLFGAVTGKEVSEALGAQFGVEVAKQQLVLDPIKTFGVHEVRAKLGYEVSVPFSVEVVEAT
jgi:large subunit ribosomal protein L9